MSAAENFFTRFTKTLTQPRPRPNNRAILDRAWESVLFEASQESNWSKHIHQTEIPTHLQLISDLLVRETTSLTSSNTDLDPPSSSSSTSATELFIQKDILTDLVKISENDVPVGFRAEVMHFSSSLVQFLDNRILSQVAITRPLLQLITMHASGSDTYDEDVLELEYNIAAKIREQPLLLDMYFFKKEPAVPVHDIQDSSSSSNSTTSDVLVSPELVEGGSLTEAGVGDSGSAAGAGGVDVPNSSSTSEYEFLIYDHLLRNIHQDGGVGDIARTGIMFLFELAADERLAAYIAASDFSNLAIAGLYSQLPNSLPKSDRGERAKAFQSDMDSFIKLFQFIQNVIIVCPNPQIISLLLNEFKSSFLDAVVASSFTGSSDFDGTTVAILFYMLRIIKSINEENLSKLISEFLLKADYDDDDDNNNSTTATTSSNDEMKLYLRDIIISKLNSLSEEVVTSCLVLFNELISSHGKFALPLLIEKLPKCVLEKSTGDVESDIKRLEVHRHRLVHTFSTDIQHHDSIMDRYLQILPSDFEGVGERSLDAYLQEANRFAENYQRVFKRGRSAFIEFMPRSSSLSNESFDVLASSPSLPSGFPYGHDGSPYTTAIVPPMLPNGDFDGDGEEAVVVEVGAQGDDALGATVPLKKASVMNTMEINSNNKIHSLKQDMIQLGRDTTLRKFISKFSTYFSHTYEINLALTGVISQLASAPQPALYLYMFCADTMLDSEDQEDEENGEQQRQSLFTVLERLGKELSDRRAQISDYNRQLNIVRGKLFASTSSSNFIKGISAAATSTTAGLSSLAERRNKRQSIFTNLADLDLDTEFLKNVVLLEETMKEFVAILLLHSSREYARTDYI